MVTTTTARPKPKFRTSFSTLFAILRIGLANYGDNQPAFLAKNLIWTILWGTDMLEEVTAISNMPDEYTRAAQIAEIKEIYDTNVVASISIFADLSSLIEQSFTESQWATKKIEAGSKHWGKAASNAGKCTLGLSAGVTFITNNETALTDGGMIATFQADFTELATNNSTFGTNYKNAEVEAHLQTDAKIEACNEIYVKYMVMAKVAKNIFRNNKSMKNGFVFGTLKKTINPQHQVLETVKIKKGASKTIHNAVIDAVITNIGTVDVLVCSGKIACTPIIIEVVKKIKEEIKEETKETTASAEETKTVTEETKTTEETKADDKADEPKALAIGTGIKLSPGDTMINTLGEIITFTDLDALIGAEITIKRTVHDK